MGNTTPSSSLPSSDTSLCNSTIESKKHKKFISEGGRKNSIAVKNKKKIDILVKPFFCLPCRLFFMNMMEHKEHQKEVTRIDKYLLENFEFISLLGSGTYGQVFKVKDLKDGLPKALKYIPLRKGKTEEIALEILKKLSHENIIRYYGSEKKEKYCYILMELADMDLSKYISKSELLSKNYMKYELVSQIAAAIDYLHNGTVSIIHRDLKPQNILILNNKPKITDFGTSKIKASNNPLLNSTVQGVAGTELYIPPELQRTMNDELVICNAKHDIWSFGIIVHQIFANNKLPFDMQNNRNLKTNMMLGKYTVDSTIMKNSLAYEIITG